ncbi:MAG TPA: phage portal protein [Gryllotalpicola sp.]
MGAFTRARSAPNDTERTFPYRWGSTPRPRIPMGDAMRHSVVWTAVQTRAALLSTLPIDVFRKVDGIDAEVPAPPFFSDPSTTNIDIIEWFHSSQTSLDTCGNAFGIIREADRNGKPAKIDLVDYADVIVRVRKDKLSYWIRGQKYTPDEIWHERQYTLPGLVVGLSPIAHAAWSLGLWRSAQEFADSWFSKNGAIPRGILRNIKRTLNVGEAQKVKDQYRASLQAGDIFVTGSDWELDMAQVAQNDAVFLNAIKATEVEQARFFGMPRDLADIDFTGSTVTYANVTQRNLQFLTINFQPVITRREKFISRNLLPAPRHMKFNSRALLRLDPKAQAELLIAEVAGRVRAPSEARALMNLQPFTPDQLAEFDRLWPKNQPTAKSTTQGE